MTYLLFYRDVRKRSLGSEVPKAQRIRYLVAGVVVPVVLVAWAAAALASGSAHRLGWMIQLMFFLVGWHYVKQGFGVLTVLSARRGVVFGSLERRVLLAHCFAAWAYAWASPWAPGREVEEKGVVYFTIAQPAWLEVATAIAFLATALAVFAVLLAKWRREGKPPPLTPLVGFLVTLWLWTVYSSLDPLLLYVIPALHSIQYLFFVWLLKKNEARAEEGPPTFGRPVGIRLGILVASALGLGWILFHGAPELLDAQSAGATSDLGPTPYFAAIFAVVNIHHYFMDHVIWRRENPETRYLRG